MIEDEDDDSGEVVEGYWEKVFGYISENQVDTRWILRYPNDSRAHGSLRIVSHPDLKPGYLRAYSSFVTSRRPKTPNEIVKAVEEYKMHETELEVYSIDEHIETFERVLEDRYQSLEKIFNVKIFGR